MDQPNIVGALLAAIASNQPTFTVGNTPIKVVPEGYTLEQLDELLPQPARKTGTISLHDADSFIRYVNDHKAAESRIYVDADFESGHVKFVAVLNEHQPGADADINYAAWRDHRAVFAPRQTPEWKAWLSKNRNKFNQQEFGEFLEYHMPEIVSPEGSRYPQPAQLLEFALNLEETKKVRFRSSSRLQNGQVQFEYVEEGADSTKGKLDAFEAFAVGISPFFNGSAYQLDAKLRYRISNEGVLTFWYELQRPDKALEDAARELLAQVQEKAGVPVLFGSAC
ncbi:YfdQ family protein [Crenobacter caeni]|uniref:DUF2303 family protein n=1 Tax=Crenobacter caeni TaxID=2705474 RepID=A0A6B2KNB3_9NEIS|nr:DUF2303 family protein [Crenobacter caeni]NDV11648.1 DUF2303 family protein [Crenobacter caeni]